MAVIKKYTDIDMNLGLTPKKDVRKKVDAEAINQHLRLLLLTEQDDIPFLNNVSADLRNLLFQPSSPFISNTMENVIDNIIRQFEKRITLDDIVVKAEANDVTVTINYTINQTRLVGTFRTILKRVR